MKNNRTAFSLASNIIAASATIMFTATSMSAAILEDASSYAILGGTAVTFSGASNDVTGNVGVSPGNSITGSEIVAWGTSSGIDNVNASAAHSSLGSAITYLESLSITDTSFSSTGVLSGTLYAGVYDLGTAASFSGTITLDAGGSSNAIFVFIIDTTLTTAASSIVTITNGSASVYWVVGSSATLGSYSTLVGNVLAEDSITIGTYATLYGRALALTAATGLDGYSTVDYMGVLDGLTIVPEPGTYALIGSSLVLGFALFRKGARRKVA
jgi:hypothetical protein